MSGSSFASVAWGTNKSSNHSNHGGAVGYYCDVTGGAGIAPALMTLNDAYYYWVIGGILYYLYDLYHVPSKHLY